MRFFADGPAMPDTLLERCDAGQVVFLCGAGVSLPSGMPDFVGLTRHVIDFFDPPEDSDIMAAFEPWLHDPPGPKVPLDQIFYLLQQEYGRNEVNALVTGRLCAVPKAAGKVFHEHGLIKRISSSLGGAPQIVTTNFDRLFEMGEVDGALEVHVPPAFPDLAFGAPAEGITYLHGRLAELDAIEHGYVLSSADLGRAYLSEAWATNFVRNLLERYTVVLVGYQAEDPPIKYLLQGLSEGGERDRSRLYVLDKGRPEDIEARWRDRGATAIAYADHEQLWRTMEAWADRADDPRGWRASVISTTKRDPKGMAPHERGQVAHVLRTVQGARLFSEVGPDVHPEWICVLDANVRSCAQGGGHDRNSGGFDTRHAYGIDDDVECVPNEGRRQGTDSDSLLVWRPGDDNPHSFHRLSELQLDFERVPARLGHLANWIRKSLHSPVLAWWAVRQNGLHPRLLDRIFREISDNENLHDTARHVWRLILDHHRDPRNRQPNFDWFHLKRRIAAEGWTASVLRDFRQASRPRVKIRPPFGPEGSQPPAGEWDDIRQADEIGRFEVKLLEEGLDDIEVTDAALPEVFRILEDQLSVASGLLSDIGTVHFRTPTCYPGREVDGESVHSDAAGAVTFFVQLFERVVEWNPELAKAYAVTWPVTDRFYFRKLKLYAVSRKALFEADYATRTVLSLDQHAFWDGDVARELLFLLADRWEEFSLDERVRLADRILEGPDQPDHWLGDDFPSIRIRFAARYGRCLELQGCHLTPEHAARLAGIVASIPDWSDGLAKSTVAERGVQLRSVGIDDAPDVLMDVPVSEVVVRAKEVPGREFDSFTERQPFKGLVKRSPRKALSALTAAGKTGDHPTGLWTAMINELPGDSLPRLKRVFLHRVTRLPHHVIVELRHPLGRWLEGNLASLIELDEDLAWSFYDHVVDGLLSGGEDAARGSRGDVFLAGKVIHRSRRTFDHAIAGPFGMCAEALFEAVPGETQEAGSLVPEHVKSRMELLFSVSGEGSDHAVSVAMSRLNWFMHVDPEWTEERLVPMLEFEHPASEPAWNGFLHSNQPPSPALAVLVKPLLLNLHSWIDGFAWDSELSEVAGQWLGCMRIFRPDKPDGLTRREMRNVLRSMSDETRSRFIFWLGRVGRANDDGWTGLVAPFIDEAWPRERRFRTTSSARSWISLLEDTGDSLPAVYAAVKRFLVPVGPVGYPFFRFTRETDEVEPITTRFPEVTLDLVSAVTPEAMPQPPHELSKILDLVAETDSSLASDPRYLRLIDLVERS